MASERWPTLKPPIEKETMILTAPTSRNCLGKARRFLTALAGCVVAAGCTSQPAKTAPTKVPSDEATCLSYGFAPGTTAYTNCIQREIDARRSGKLGPTYDQILIAPRQ